MPTDTSVDKPNYRRSEAVEADADLALVSDLLAGTRRMHEKSGTYITRWPDEKGTVYDFRRKCENLFEGLGRTLSAATGMLFAKEPGIEWNESESAMLTHADNIDAAGTALNVFVKRFSEQALRDGLALILVDHPRAPDGVTITAANEQALGLRPTWAIYPRAQAINWRDSIVDNQRVLTLLVLSESAPVSLGQYGTGTSQRYRVLQLEGGVATWTLYEESDDNAGPKSFIKIDGGLFLNRSGLPATFLPVAVAYTGRTDAIMTATIPLLGVANANLAHWQISSNLRFNTDVVGFSQLVIKGEMGKDSNGIEYPIQMGPLNALKVQVEGSVEWIGPSPDGLDQLEKRKQEKLTEMAQQGLSFLQRDTRAAETATAKLLDASAENSTLATAAQGIEDAVNVALEVHAWYMGIEKDSAPVMDISTDYTDTSMQADMLSAYVGAIRDAGLPVRILLDAMQAGGLLPPDADIDELEAEMAVNEIAASDVKRQAQADALANAAQQVKAA